MNLRNVIVEIDSEDAFVSGWDSDPRIVVEASCEGMLNGRVVWYVEITHGDTVDTSEILSPPEFSDGFRTVAAIQAFCAAHGENDYDGEDVRLFDTLTPEQAQDVSDFLMITVPDLMFV